MIARAGTVTFAVLAWLALPRPAAALQPLDAFLEAARTHSPANQQAQARHAQRTHQARAVKWQLAPSLSVSGSYTRNQYERSLTFPGASEPQAFIEDHQLDAVARLSVPLVNVGAWERTQAANAATEAASAQQDAAAFEVDRQVVRTYYQVLANEAVRDSAQRSLELAESNQTFVQQRHAAGVASELDLQRARADVARAQQDVAAAELAVTVARRRLGTLSGLSPQPAERFPEDDLESEAPLAHWLQSSETVPNVRAAEAQVTASERQMDAARGAWYPTLTASAQERYSNATALVGHAAYYAIKVEVAWQLDGRVVHEVRAQRAEAAAARAEAEQRRLQARDAIYESWHQVRSGIQRAQAARTQAEAAARAAELAGDRYASGVATQLDVLAANQDAFRAEVARIQADADLAYARAALRLYAGQSPGEPTP